MLTTKALRRRIGIHYGLPPRPGRSTPRWATNRELEEEFRALARRGYAGVCGDARREALRNLFVQWGRDPLDPEEQKKAETFAVDPAHDLNTWLSR